MTALYLVSFSNPVTPAYVAFTVVFLVGLAVIVVRKSWEAWRGIDRLIVLGPNFYAAPLAAFGTQHFSFAKFVATMVPKWIPWHLFWTYFLGICFIAAALSLVTGIQARLSAGLLALTFFLFVAFMDAPGYARQPKNWISGVLMLRQLAFSGGALALFASLNDKLRDGRALIWATLARYFIAVPLLVYAVEQFLHADHVPGIPLEKLTPSYVPGHAIWSYVTAAVYVVCGLLLIFGRKTGIAAVTAGLTVLVVELVVYVPIAVVQRSNIEGFNYMADTFMFCGALLMLARAMVPDA